MHPVTPAVFGAIECAVSLIQQVVGTCRCIVGGGDAGAQGDRKLLAACNKVQFGKALADFIENAPGLFGRAVRQHHQELFTAIAAQAVDAPQALAQQVGQGADDVVAGGVAVAVVDLLEEIDIQHGHAGWLACRCAERAPAR